TGHDFLKSLGISLIPATAPDFFTEDTPTAVLVRQVLGAIAQFDKTSLVAKLRAARDRKKAATGKCEGRKSYAEARPESCGAGKRAARSARVPAQNLGRASSARLRHCQRQAVCRECRAGDARVGSIVSDGSLFSRAQSRRHPTTTRAKAGPPSVISESRVRTSVSKIFGKADLKRRDS